MANVKLSQIASGGAVAPSTDTAVAVRSGTTDVLISFGTVVTENLSSVIIDNGAGALTIGAGQVTSSMLAGAVAPGKISLTDTHILVGNGSNIAADVAMSGDVSISDTGATTLATINAGIGTFGSSSLAAIVTANAKGQITAISSTLIQAAASALVGTTLASNVVTSSLTTVGTIGTGTWQGTKIGLAYGGTNADLSATGGTSQILKQVTSGAAVTVGQLAASDLSNGTSGSGAVVLASAITNAKLRTITFNLDGSGSAIASGGTWYLSDVPYAGTITAWNIVADQSGSIVIDVWKTNAAVPTVANTITASSLPTLSSAQSAFVGSISGWTTAVTVGDVFAFHVNSAATVTKISLTITVTAS